MSYISEVLDLIDTLDTVGLAKEADELDFVLKQSSRELSHEVWNFIDGLKWHLKNAVLNNNYPGVNQENISDILNILDEASGKRPPPRMQTGVHEKKQEPIVLNPSETALAQLEMEKSRLELQQVLKVLYDKLQKTQNPAEIVTLQKQFDDVKRDLDVDEEALKRRKYEAKLLEERYPDAYKIYHETYMAGKRRK